MIEEGEAGEEAADDAILGQVGARIAQDEGYTVRPPGPGRPLPRDDPLPMEEY